MSVQIPTAEGSPPDRSPPDRRLPGWVLVTVGVLLVGSMIVAAVTADDSDGAEVGHPGTPSLPLDQWGLTIFPGAGVFVDVAAEGGRAIAVAREGTDWSAPPGRSSVWARADSEEDWRWIEVSTPGDWSILSVALDGDWVLAGGALDAGLPAAALWSGRFGEPLQLIELPIDQPARIELVRTLGDRTVIVARITSDFAGSESGVSRVLVRISDRWTDVTPPGEAVVISEIIEHGIEWLAVGSDEGSPAAWTSTDEGRTWRRTEVGVRDPGRLTDVTVANDQVHAIAHLTNQPPVTTQLVTYDGRSWTPVGASGPRHVSWIEPLQGDLVGGPSGVTRDGPFLPFLWRHLTRERWAVVEMQRPPGSDDGWPTSFTAATNGMVVGTALGQPAMWQPREAQTRVVVPSAVDPEWIRLGPLPGNSRSVRSANDELYSFSYTPDASGPAAFVSSDGRTWNPLDLPDGMVFAELQAAGDNVVMAGYTDRSLLISVREGDGFRVVAELEGRLHALGGTDTEIEAYVLLAGTMRRVTISVATGRVTETELPWRLLFVELLGDQVVVAGESESDGWPPTTVHVSTDGGSTWTSFDVEFWAWHRLGNGLLLQGRPGQPAFFLRTKPAPSLALVTTPPDLAVPHPGARAAVQWGDRLVVYDGTGRLTVFTDFSTEPESIGVSIGSGFHGVFGWPVGDRYVVGSEQGQSVLYRWTGELP